jgi:hypothetical protein
MQSTSTIKLGTFTTRNGERRIYVNGTTREKIYYTTGTGYLESSRLPGFYKNSDALRVQPNTSSVSTRRTKDNEAFNLAADFILETFGENVTFDQVWNSI